MRRCHPKIVFRIVFGCLLYESWWSHWHGTKSPATQLSPWSHAHNAKGCNEVGRLRWYNCRFSPFQRYNMSRFSRGSKSIARIERDSFLFQRCVGHTSWLAVSNNLTQMMIWMHVRYFVQAATFATGHLSLPPYHYLTIMIHKNFSSPSLFVTPIS